MKKLLSPHTLLTSIAFVVAMLFPYERMVVAADATVISRYDNRVQERFTSTIDYVNEYRLRHGRSTLQSNALLNDVARKRAEEIIHTGLFSHFDNEGRTFYKYFSAQDRPDVACENISSSKSDAVSVSFAGWKKSPPHDECMLDERMKQYGFYQIKVNKSTSNTIFIAVLIAGS